MASTPSPSPRARKRRRTRPRDSIEDDEDDHALDAMLVELGIPQKNHKPPNTSPSIEVIELITPPKKKKQSDGLSVVDLTTSPSSPCPSPSNGYINTVQAVDEEPMAFEDQNEISFSYSPSESPPPFVYSLPEENMLSTTGTITTGDESDDPEILSPEMTRQLLPNERQAGVKQARRLSGRLKDLHSETTRSSGSIRLRKEKTTATTGERPIRTTATPTKSRTASPSRSRATGSSSAGKRSGSGVIAVVQMERSLDTSEAGNSIRQALKNHVYNGKPVPFTVATALNCIMPGVIRWERKERGDSHFSCAIYYEAVAFLEMIQQKSYKELVSAVKYLETLIPKSQQQSRKSQEEEEEPSKIFVVIQGMDRALIELKKQQKEKTKNGSGPRCSYPMISFADLQEVAFQLFMDTGAHTKFTSDLEAMAEYVALLTREFVEAASRPTALEEVLESVPRYNSFRVTHSGATVSMCANAWLRMLQVIPGVSEDKAQCLLDHFPTFNSLMCAYRDPTLSRAQKEDLVADKLHDARIQRALSKRIYAVFCEEDPDALI